MRRLTVVFAVIVATLLPACDNREAAVLPTMAVFDTRTPTPTLTRTPVPTSTPTDTPTVTPSRTPEDTPTVTLTPSNTPLPSLTPTNTVTPTATTTPSPTNTPTTTRTATPDSVAIISLSVSPDEALPGAQINVQWRTDGEAATLEIQNKTGTTVDILSVPPNGERTYTLPSSIEELAVFRLTARRGTMTATRSAPVTLDCRGLWFFTPTRVPVGTCPEGQTSVLNVTYQPFQRGYMLRMSISGQAAGVYALYGGTQAGPFISYLNQFTLNNQTGIPDGLFATGDAFTGIYLEFDAPTGNDYTTEIGYATAAQQTIAATIQREADTNALYLGLPDGTLFRIERSANPIQGAWVRLP